MVTKVYESVEIHPKSPHVSLEFQYDVNLVRYTLATNPKAQSGFSDAFVGIIYANRLAIAKLCAIKKLIF